MLKRSRWLPPVAWMAVWLMVSAAAGRAEDAVGASAIADAKAAPPSAAASQASLSASQQQLANEFKDLQGVLMRTRDLIRSTDPNRAALIEKALKESGDRRVNADFQEIIELLQKEKLGDAVRRQGKVNEDLEAILQLLLSENRAKVLQKQKDAIRKSLAILNGIIRDQKDLQGRNAGGEDPKSLSPPQGELAKQTGKLSKDIRDNQEKYQGNGKDDAKDNGQGDAKKNGKKDGAQPDKDGKDSMPGKDGAKADGKPGDKGDGKADSKGDGKAKAGNGEKSDSKGDGKAKAGNGQGKGKGKGKGKSGQGQGQGQGEGQDQDSSDPSQQAQDPNAPPQEQNPVLKQLEEAQKHMKQAQQALDKAKKDGALGEQQKAIDNLNQAKAQLEDILRQLREEEMKVLLARLEARFQKVLIIQREIYSGTTRLDKVPVAERSHGHEIESGRLSNREAEIVQEVTKALDMLREEGSSVAMPEAVEQVRDDMQQIVYRLAEGKTEALTQAIETDVIKGLEEILDALKKAQRDIDNRKKPPGASPNGEPQDPPLIEMLSELKMIRALQMRVNRRTERYSKLVQGEQADKDDVFDALKRLSEQQKRVYKITRDLEMGKNE